MADICAESDRIESRVRYRRAAYLHKVNVPSDRSESFSQPQFERVSPSIERENSAPTGGPRVGVLIQDNLYRMHPHQPILQGRQIHKPSRGVNYSDQIEFTHARGTGSRPDEELMPHRKRPAALHIDDHRPKAPSRPRAKQ